jgi:membrane protein DedA with SNARE-associated domain
VAKLADAFALGANERNLMGVQVSPSAQRNMDTSNFIIEILKIYQMPAIFLGSFFFGETVVLAASFLSAQGLWSVWTVFWLSLLGTLASDALWFIYGQKVLSYFHRWEKYRSGSERFIKALERITGSRPFLALLFIKPVYGTRILTIIYLSIRKVNFLTFMIFDALGSAFWLSVLSLFGWLAGRSIVNLVPWVNTLEYAALAIVLVVVLWRLIFTWLSKKTIEEVEKE